MPIAQFDIDKGYTVFTESDYQTKKHAHYAIEIVCCTEGTFDVTTPIAAHKNIKSVIIPSNLPHSFSCVGAACDLLFLDPLSPIGTHFRQRYQLVSRKDVIADSTELTPFYKEGRFDIPFMQRCIETSRADHLDPRIMNCLRKMDAIITHQKITLSQLAEASCLSESRLSHLFKEQLGISVHQCILWKKILLAVLKSQEGHSLTACAHYVGFSDSSHFCKVFSRMFGIHPFFVLRT